MATSALARFVDRSNMPLHIKNRVLGITQYGSETQGRIEAAGHTLRQTGESAVLGSILGAYHGMSPKGLDAHGIPADAAVSGLGFLGALLVGDGEMKHEIRNVASTGAAVFAFRKTAELVAAKKAHVAVAGEDDDDIYEDDEDFDVSEDELLAAARGLDE
jgi:hypothetical protein